MKSRNLRKKHFGKFLKNHQRNLKSSEIFFIKHSLKSRYLIRDLDENANLKFIANKKNVKLFNKITAYENREDAAKLKNIINK